MPLAVDYAASVSFRLHVQAVRTKNVKRGEKGEGMRGKKNSSAVKQHPVLMLHSIPGRANSRARKEQLSCSVSPCESCYGFFFSA